MPHTWAALAEMAEKNVSLNTLSVIVAALCKHNQGQPGGSGEVAVSDFAEPKPKAKPAKPAKAKKRK